MNTDITVPQQGLLFTSAILTGQLAPSSIAMYERDFKTYLAYAVTPDLALEATTLARWRTYLATNTDMSPNTINRMLSAVKRLIKEAAQQGYTSHETALEFSRVEGVKTSALKTRTKTTARTRISPEQMRALTDSPDHKTLVGVRDYSIASHIGF